MAFINSDYYYYYFRQLLIDNYIHVQLKNWQT